jgi:hypothetical protein
MLLSIKVPKVVSGATSGSKGVLYNLAPSRLTLDKKLTFSYLSAR